MGKEMIMYYDVGNEWQEKLKGRLESLGLDIKGIDSARETPIVQDGQTWLYGVRGISFYFFPPRRLELAN